MKMNKMLTLVCGLALGSHLAAQQPRYELIWQEDFNGSTFDEKYWTKIPRGNADWCRHMSDEPSLYEVKDGNLILRGKVNDGIVPQDTARYITGGLYTKDKKTITHGKLKSKPNFRLLREHGRLSGCFPTPEHGPTEEKLISWNG